VNFESLGDNDDVELSIRARILFNEDFNDWFLRVVVAPSEAAIKRGESKEFARFCQKKQNLFKSVGVLCISRNISDIL
jgi:hypothetical protein